MNSKLITVVAGVGSGTGSSIAKKFAETYPVVLLARKPDSYDSLIKEINGSGGKAIGISTDVTNGISVEDAFSKMKEEYGKDVALAVCILVPIVEIDQADPRQLGRNLQCQRQTSS